MTTTMRRAAALAIVALAATAACTDGYGDDGSGSAGADLACTHFRNIVGDIADGVLTDAEARAKFQEVEDSASGAEEADIRSSARELVAAMTTGTADDVAAAAIDMGAACDAAGF